LEIKSFKVFPGKLLEIHRNERCGEASSREWERTHKHQNVIADTTVLLQVVPSRVSVSVELGFSYCFRPVVIVYVRLWLVVLAVNDEARVTRGSRWVGQAGDGVPRRHGRKPHNKTTASIVVV